MIHMLNKLKLFLFPGIYGQCEKNYLLSELNYGISTLYYKWNSIEINDLGSCSNLNLESLNVVGEILLNCSGTDVIITDCESNMVWSDCASPSIPTCEELISGTSNISLTVCEEKCTCPYDYPYWNGDACVNEEQCLSSTTTSPYEPTLRPTHAPTLAPTYGPTLRPTIRLSSRPILHPTSRPTLSRPISGPTSRPTIIPTIG